MRVLVVVVACALGACGSEAASPIAPSPTPRPATNYQGQWVGEHTIAACNGTGGFAQGFCSTFAVGTTLPVTLTLTQTGRQVSGTLAMGALTGSVSGPVSTTNDHLLLAGSIISISNGTTTTIVVQGWDTFATGTSMTGGWGTTWTLSSLGGAGQIVHAIRTLIKVG